MDTQKAGLEGVASGHLTTGFETSATRLVGAIGYEGHTQENPTNYWGELLSNASLESFDADQATGGMSALEA